MTRRLTDTIRNAFVKAVMDDVPSIDYNTKIRDFAMEEGIKTFPPDALKVFKKRADFFATFNRVAGGTYAAFKGDPEKIDEMVKPGTPFSMQCNNWHGMSRQQEGARQALAAKVKGMIFAYSTVESAAKGMPEFAKYLPDAAAPIDRSLPIANVVADLTKAGWPKGKKK